MSSYVKTNRKDQQAELQSTWQYLNEGWARRDGTKAKFAPQSPSTPRSMFAGLRKAQMLPHPSAVEDKAMYRAIRNGLKAQRKAR